jgi:repressor LexA
MELPELTYRQQQVYDFIKNHINEWSYPPTLREIGAALGIRSTNGVSDHLRALKRKGYLTQDGMKSRTLKPRELEEPSEQPLRALVSGDTISIPILGRVAAGEPILAEENAEGSVVIDTMLVGRGQKVFALKVVGESMIEAGILPNDFIFVKKRSHADNGSIVVVMIDNEATVKRFFAEGDKIRLQPENSTMKPILVHKKDFRQVQIIGIVVGVYRQTI